MGATAPNPGRPSCRSRAVGPAPRHAPLLAEVADPRPEAYVTETPDALVVPSHDWEVWQGLDGVYE
ncbi:MAG TPA: hypothetical protein VHF45_09015 [Thermoleophilaceae bacterium]|jgi:hypothetical protein|nr:hypothetical protein [Thermoleophilaceae bacterium]